MLRKEPSVEINIAWGGGGYHGISKRANDCEFHLIVSTVLLGSKTTDLPMGCHL